MEIEVKLTYKNKKNIIAWLKENNFVHQKDKNITDLYFSQGNNTMSNSKALYRIRKIDGELIECTLKDQCIDNHGVWSRREINVSIDNLENMRLIFESLSCQIVKDNYSKREIWAKGNSVVEFIDFIRPAKLSLIEIEGESQAAVDELITSLGDNVTIAGEEIFASFDKKKS